MSILEIEITEAEMFALKTVASNPQTWADNVLTNRARVAKEELKTNQAWTQVAVAVAADGGDASDDWAVLLKGRDLGLFKTAAQNQEELQAAQSIEAPMPETPEQSLSVKVLAHALALKIGAVNAMRTDGGDPYPVSSDALTAVRERYTDIVSAYTTKVALGDDITDEETATVRLIQQGFALFAAINYAAETIIQSGEVSEPVAADPRWPLLGA